MKREDWSRFEFLPQTESTSLVPLIEKVILHKPKNNDEWRKLLRQNLSSAGKFFSKSQIIEGFRKLGSSERFGITEDSFLSLLKLKPIRTQSGVVPVTVLTKPFPCPGQCIFCPNDVRMPKSYLSDEPGAQRAARNRFDPFAQTWNRLVAFYKMGHAPAKIELIILGGTWSSYPLIYQIDFISQCFAAVNLFGQTSHPEPIFIEETARPDFLDLENTITQTPELGETLSLYNTAVKAHLRESLSGSLLAPHEHGTWNELTRLQVVNESAAARIVGLVVETRPDQVNTEELVRLRRLGVTKVQIGVQSLDEQVLSMNRRGHTVQQTRSALRLLRQAGFKVQAHWMANLYGSSPEADLSDYKKLFSEKDVCPDELKLYPCSLIPKTELMTHYEQGHWRPYTRNELLDLLVMAMVATPEYCRLSRVIRDIPGDNMHTESHGTNFREVAETEIIKRGLQLSEIRAREVKNADFDFEQVTQRIFEYSTSVSKEYFLQLECGQTLLAFLRLSIPCVDNPMPELESSAIIREVHVYGKALEIGDAKQKKAQHRGFGRRMVEWACTLAQENGFSSIAVISSVGTRIYYRKLGFVDGELYQHRYLPPLS